MRREAMVAALSAINVDCAAAADGSWTLGEAGTKSAGTVVRSVFSGPAFDATGNSDSSAP